MFFYGGIMNKIYLVLAVLTAFLFVYLIGINTGVQKCQKKIMRDDITQQRNLIHVKEKINAEVISTGTDDIRRILREKYTIAD